MIIEQQQKENTERGTDGREEKKEKEDLGIDRKICLHLQKKRNDEDEMKKFFSQVDENDDDDDDYFSSCFDRQNACSCSSTYRLDRRKSIG